MTTTDVQFAGSIPERYDEYLVPLFFEPYAEDLARRASELRARRVLDVAAGTGVVTQALLRAIPDAEIDATDLNPEMLARAASRVQSPRVRWSPADAMRLPFEDGRFDLVACQCAVMFFPDRAAAFREARRVLAPGGAYLVSVWDDLARNEVARIVNDAVASLFPQAPPDFMARVPHGHGDPLRIERELRAGGFAQVECEAVSRRSRAASARDAALGVCEGTPLRHEILARDPAGLPRAVESATRALRAELGDGAVDAEMRAFVFTCR
ncbi:MAG TPA: class I SAM-dependent methyltransferase [Anaeromyxobacteraceae bacterium]|nr:class I SAM-dependent methyltransferase [Anaeromyxobacteraceae bacterium]